MSEVLKIPEGLNPAPFTIVESIRVATERLIRLYELKYSFAGGSHPLYNLRQIEAKLWLASFELCHIGSEVAAEYLIREHKELFNGIALMGTNRGELKNGWKFHEACVAQDKKGIWYILSPANFNADPRKDRLNRVFTSSDLNQNLADLEREDGGKWASAEFIEEAFASHPRALPVPVPPNGFYHDGIKFFGPKLVQDKRYLIGNS